jgi:hypothetical protein
MLSIEKRDGMIYLYVGDVIVWAGSMEQWSQVISHPITRDTPKAA